MDIRCAIKSDNCSAWCGHVENRSVVDPLTGEGMRYDQIEFHKLGYANFDCNVVVSLSTPRHLCRRNTRPPRSI